MLSTQPQQSCPLCGSLGSGQMGAMDLALFGAEKYAWCPVCFSAVEKPWSREYRIRWNREMASRSAERMNPAADEDSTPLGPPLRNTRGTQCYFRLLLQGSVYYLTLCVGHRKMTVGAFKNLSLAMKAYLDFEQELRRSGFVASSAPLGQDFLGRK